MSKGSRTKESLAVIAIFIVSLSRIILGAHYLTDVVGGIFLSIAAQAIASLILTSLARQEKEGFFRVTQNEKISLGKS